MSDDTKEIESLRSKLEAAESQIERMRMRESNAYKVNQILIASGLLTQEILNIAEDFLGEINEKCK